jgi:hypothetical protein
MSSTRKALLTAVAILGASMLIAAPASATFPGHNGLIAFQAQTAAGVQMVDICNKSPI